LFIKYSNIHVLVIASELESEWHETGLISSGNVATFWAEQLRHPLLSRSNFGKVSDAPHLGVKQVSILQGLILHRFVDYRIPVGLELGLWT